VRAPGRVDLIGAHVDYNDGFVLPAAIDRDVWLAVGPAEGTTTVVALDLDLRAEFGPADVEARRDARGGPLAGWARYPAGVAWALAEAGHRPPALRAVLTGDVPVGAGVSSSAAVEVAFGVAWRALGGLDIDDMGLARLCRRAENEYVGVACGLMDPFASLFGRQGHALLLDCRSLAWEAVPLPEDVALVVADTGTRRQLADGALNARQAQCAEATRRLAARLPGVRALRDVTPADIDRLADELPEPLLSRARHVVDENARVLAMAEALRRGDAGTAGALMSASHVSARDLYDASGPALEAMWRAAARDPACLGGRFIGAGFAGCLVFLARADGADALVANAAPEFRAATGLTPRLYRVRPADGAEVLPAHLHDVS